MNSNIQNKSMTSILFEDLLNDVDVYFWKCLNELIDRSKNSKGTSTSSYLVERPCCNFCKNNAEPKKVYMSHITRDRQTNEVICPILRRHVCEVCGATGAKSHTRSYCPYSKIIRRNVEDVNIKYLFYNMKSLSHKN